jgi:hypothetical protein
MNEKETEKKSKFKIGDIVYMNIKFGDEHPLKIKEIISDEIEKFVYKAEYFFITESKYFGGETRTLYERNLIKMDEYRCECGKTHKKVFRGKESKIFVEHFDKRIGRSGINLKKVTIDKNGKVKKENIPIAVDGDKIGKIVEEKFIENIVGIGMDGSTYRKEAECGKCKIDHNRMLLSEVDEILGELKDHHIKNILKRTVVDGDWIVNWRLELKQRYDEKTNLIEKSFKPVEKYKYDRIVAMAQGKKLTYFKRLSNRRILKKLLS